jgi:hypothetical protein
VGEKLKFCNEMAQNLQANFPESAQFAAHGLLSTANKLKGVQ